LISTRSLNDPVEISMLLQLFVAMYDYQLIVCM